MSSDTFQVQRFGEESQENLQHEQELLAKLKRKIAGSIPEVKTKEEPSNDIKEVTEPKKKKKKRKREKSPNEENTGFTKLGVFDAKDKAKVRRVLPKWLAQPGKVPTI